MMSRVMEEFFEFIDNQCLIDLLLIGTNFIWFRAEDSTSKSRLDRFMASTYLEMVPAVLPVPLLTKVGEV